MLSLLFRNCSPKCTIYCKINFKLQYKSENKYYILEEKCHYILKTKYVYKRKCNEGCTLPFVPIVGLSICRFYMTFFRVSPWCLFCMQKKLVSALENKEQLIGFRVYGKVQQVHKWMETDNDGRTASERHANRS